MPQELDPYILSTMTDSERASIQEEQTPEEVAAQVAIDTGAENGPDDPADELPVDPPDAATDPAAATAKMDSKITPAEAEDPAPDTSAGAGEADKPFTPTYNAKLPDDFAAQQEGLQGKADALAQRFKDGDFDFDAYRVEEAALAKEENALNELRLKATLSQEMAAQAAEQQWNHTVQSFMTATAKAEGIDYKTDTEKNADLDMFVRFLAHEPKNEDKAPEWFLTEAHKCVKARHGIGLVTPPVVVDPKISRKPPLEAAPKTLAQVPGGDGPGDVDGNEFSDVDRLSGDPQEDAIRKMTPAQRDRYMAGV